MSCNHIMVDLETLGKKPGCVIASIGAVTFDPIAGQIGDSFYMRIDPQSCVQAGLQLDVDTVLWWMRQGDEARAEISGKGLLGILTTSLDALGYFMGARGVRYFWSHGSNFDGPILAAAYDAVGMKLPWEYWNARDTRTIFDLAGVKPDRAAGVHHNALNDAEAQARVVIEAYRKLGLATPAEPIPTASEILAQGAVTTEIQPTCFVDETGNVVDYVQEVTPTP